ncbi:MAG: cell division protein FtsH, partial [Anaerolineae bacterium]
RRNKKHISMAEMQESIEKVVYGPERRSRIITEEERKITAYHEAGHALVAKLMPNTDPVQKVSIVARGIKRGITRTLPEDDKTLISRGDFASHLAVMMGGRAAEELVFVDVTTEAEGDLERATKLARSMVTQYGMSEQLGPLTFGEKEELVFLGKEIGEQRNYSEDVARQIDREIRRLMEEAYEAARRIITDHRDKLVEIAEKLMQEETLDAQAFNAIFA